MSRWSWRSAWARTGWKRIDPVKFCGGDVENSLTSITLKGILHTLTAVLLLLSASTTVKAQIQAPEQEQVESSMDSTDVDSPWTIDPNRKKFNLQSFGASYRDGTSQFFDSYNYQILMSNAQQGLPIFLDWPSYSGVVVLPEYWQLEAHAAWVDTIRGLKLRAGLSYLQRLDSMATTGNFMRNDTVFGRNASEFARFYGITLGGVKMSRKLGNFMRLYGGAEFEALLAPRSDIYFLLFAYDIGEERIIEFNEFNVKGKPRLNLYGSALLGMEMVFWKHFGFFLEVKSGLGMQVVLRERTFGIAKNAYHLGLNYYLWDYKRKPLPRPILEEEIDYREIDQ